MKNKQSLYFNQITGDVAPLSKKQAKSLPAHVKKIEFITTPEGKNAMRFNFDGAVVDVIENEDPEEITESKEE